MYPLLATGAISLAGRLIDNLTSRPRPDAAAAAGPAQKAQFANLLAKAEASPQVQIARFLDERGLRSVGDIQNRLQDLSTQLLQSPEVQSQLGGSSSDVTLQLNKGGDLTLRTSDGRERTIALSPESRKLTTEMHTLGCAARSGSDSRFASLSAPVSLRVSPGAGLTVENLARLK